jgi:hypothetical protein
MGDRRISNAVVDPAKPLDNTCHKPPNGIGIRSIDPASVNTVSVRRCQRVERW